MLRPVPFDHPDSTQLIAQVQAEYVRRYGGADATPLEAAEFAPPRGLFLARYLDGKAVACGGWRTCGADAEIKRMYVAAHARGRGIARAVLACLEDTARAAGADWLVLETGQRQPEALALYRSSGYVDVPHFGTYADARLAVHLGKRM